MHSATEHAGLWVTNFIAFNMLKRETCKLLSEWWDQIMLYTTQDQVSLPYVLWHNKIKPYSLPNDVFDGSFENNSYYVKAIHGL